MTSTATTATGTRAAMTMAIRAAGRTPASSNRRTGGRTGGLFTRETLRSARQPSRAFILCRAERSSATSTAPAYSSTEVRAVIPRLDGVCRRPGGKSIWKRCLQHPLDRGREQPRDRRRRLRRRPAGRGHVADRHAHERVRQRVEIDRGRLRPGGTRIAAATRWPAHSRTGRLWVVTSGSRPPVPSSPSSRRTNGSLVAIVRKHSSAAVSAAIGSSACSSIVCSTASRRRRPRG